MDPNSEWSTTEWREVALEIARRYDFEEGHALQDEQLALRLFDETARVGLHSLDGVPDRDSEPSPRSLLSCAAILHDIGYWYGYDAHHKHAYKMIVAAEWPGVSARSQSLIALIARYHRGRQPDPSRHASYAQLLEADRDSVRKLSAILRFADGLDRTHTRAVHDIACRLDAENLVVALTPKEGNAAERWAGQKKAQFFEGVFGVRVTLT